MNENPDLIERDEEIDVDEALEVLTRHGGLCHWPPDCGEAEALNTLISYIERRR